MILPGQGDIIGGKYRLDEVLGVGGFATVYRATDVVIQRSLAVKVLTPHQGAYPPSVPARFAVEARALGQLTNPHSIRMFDCGRTEDGVLYMVFELLGGCDLSDYLAEHGAMTEHETAHVLCQLLLSLEEAHKHGILHRDIKPANIRIYEYGGDPLRAKLMDFGIARWIGDEHQSITATGKVIGTVRYMSPEQIFGEEMTRSSDLFTLALVAHEMLTLEARPSIDFISGNAEVALPGTRLGTVLRKMLKRHAKDRYGSATEVLDALRGKAEPAPSPQPRPIKCRAPATPEPSEPSAPPESPTRRHVIVGLIACVVLASAGLLAWSSFQEQEPPIPVTPASRLSTERAQALIEPQPETAQVEAPSEPEEPASVDGCGTEASRGTVTLGDVVGLRRQMWDVYVPEGYDANKRHPLMVLFHADASSPREAMRSMSAKKMADEHQFLIVAPRKNAEIAGYRFSLDVDFVRELVERMKAEYCVDPARIFVFGTGGGGAAVETLACEPWVAAVTSMSWRRNDLAEVCSPTRAVPNLHLAPLKSKYLPVEGGMSCAGYDRMVSLEEHEALWRQQNNCTGSRKVWRREGASVCYEWDCEEAFVSCHLDGGHAFRGFPRAVDLVKCDGPPVDFPHTEVMWDFLERAFPELPTEDTPRPDDQ